MKENKKLLVVAVLLLLITVSFTSYAIFKSTTSANATLNVATWNIVFKDGATNITEGMDITFTADDCHDNSHVANGVIAPGASCTKQVILDALDTQVDVAWNVTAGNVVDGSGNDVEGVSAALNPDNGTIAFSASNRTSVANVTITWTAVDNETINPLDTALAGGTLTVPLEFTAYQVVD